MNEANGTACLHSITRLALENVGGNSVSCLQQCYKVQLQLHWRKRARTAVPLAPAAELRTACTAQPLFAIAPERWLPCLETRTEARLRSPVCCPWWLVAESTLQGSDLAWRPRAQRQETEPAGYRGGLLARHRGSIELEGVSSPIDRHQGNQRDAG